MGVEKLEKHLRMTDEQIIESIKVICAPMPECRKLRDRIIANLRIRFEDNNATG